MKYDYKGTSVVGDTDLNGSMTILVALFSVLFWK